MKRYEVFDPRYERIGRLHCKLVAKVLARRRRRNYDGWGDYEEVGSGWTESDHVASDFDDLDPIEVRAEMAAWEDYVDLMAAEDYARSFIAPPDRALGLDAQQYADYDADVDQRVEAALADGPMVHWDLDGRLQTGPAPDLER